MMSKENKRKQVQGMLLEGDFGEHTETPLVLSDPLTVTQMILKLSDIKAYDKNPRKEINPLYDEIKASVLSNKRLNNNFNITKRPGDDLFMIESGGNTRLQILNELYNETGDEAFNQVQCLFVPWSSESNILTSHLIENEMRGDMTLIDKAYAVKNLKEEMEIEMGKALSGRGFCDRSAERGYKISRRDFTRLNYAIELDQMIPQTLRTGMGVRKIDEIKKLYQSYCDYCLDKTDRFELIFIGVMSEHDDEGFKLKEVRSDLDEKLAVETGIKSNYIFLEIQSMLVNSISGQKESGDVEPQTDMSSYAESQSTQTSVADQDNTQAINNSHPETNDDIDNKTQPAATEKQSARKTREDKQPPANASIPQNESTQLTPELEDVDLISLRNKNYALICNFARPYQLENVIHQLETGFGFFIECPEHEFDIDNSDEMTAFKSNIRNFTWWFMFGLSEQNLNVSRFDTWKHTELFKLFYEQERGSDCLSKRVNNPPELRLFLALLLQCTETLSDKGFLYVFRLMENIRKIKKHYPDKLIWEHQE